MTKTDTIFALATGPGRAGIAVVRVSGRLARVAGEVFSFALPPARMASVRDLLGREGEVLDRALVLWMPGPGTATGEDVVELHLHGGPSIIASVIGRLARQQGFRLAEPGEFTRRSFENGKLDLLQVEGLADVLEAETEGQRRLAMRQLLGDASGVVEAWRRAILRALALTEAAIDFSDEGDVGESAGREALSAVAALVVELEAGLSRAAEAAAVRRGLRVVIAGAPNVGKSSLVNWLAGREAVMVSPIAGTTRDVVDAALALGGHAIVVSDTAGLRSETKDLLEVEGMRRAVKAISESDILVWVESGEEGGMSPPRDPDLWVLSKSDLRAHSVVRADRWALSVKSGDGLEVFKEALTNLIRERNALPENVVIVRERHWLSVEGAVRSLREALAEAPKGLELAADHMRRAAHHLARLTGRLDVEDVLGEIFSSFCIGK
jgi:tRNA modification GTPase